MNRNRLERLLGAAPGSPLRPFTLGMCWLLIACVVAALALLAAGVSFVYWLLALTIAAALLIALPIVALLARGHMRGLDRLLAGDYLARWPVDADTWERHAEQEWRRARDFARRGPLYALVLATLVGGAAGSTLAFAQDARGGAWVVMLAVGGFVLLAGLLVSAGTYVAGRHRYARRGRNRGDVLIGLSGVYQRGAFTPFGGVNRRLTRTELQPGDPPTLLFVTQSMTQYGTRLDAETRVPVPPGKEGDARDLVDVLRREVIRP